MQSKSENSRHFMEMDCFEITTLMPTTSQSNLLRSFHLIALRFTFIFFLHLRPSLPIGLFTLPRGLIKLSLIIIIATCPAHLIRLDFIALILHSLTPLKEQNCSLSVEYKKIFTVSRDIWTTRKKFYLRMLCTCATCNLRTR